MSHISIVKNTDGTVRGFKLVSNGGLNKKIVVSNTYKGIKLYNLISVDSS